MREEISDEVRAEIELLLSHPLHFPDEFKRWMGDFVATNVPMIPFSHIFGSRVNIARSGNTIITAETAPGGTYGDMATVGPQITDIADGKYLLMYGARGRDRTSISVNGATAVDDDSIWGEEAGPSAGRMKIVSMNNDNLNTVCLKYKGSGTISHRWLTIMRLGSPGE